MTGNVPFPEFSDYDAIKMILRGKRPLKPPRFEAPGMTPAVWKIAEKCWHEKAKERPEVSTILRYLETLANPGVYVRFNLERRQLTFDYGR